MQACSPTHTPVATMAVVALVFSHSRLKLQGMQEGGAACVIAQQRGCGLTAGHAAAWVRLHELACPPTAI